MNQAVDGDDLNVRKLRSRRIKNETFERTPSFCSHETVSSSSNTVAVSERVISRKMAVFASLSALNPFSGRPEEDVLDFLKHFELWASIEKADDVTLRAGLPLLLKGGAAAWYDTQRQEIKDSYEELKSALKVRYGRQEAQLWQAMAELWQTKQTDDQSTDDYVTAILRAGQRIKVGEDQIFAIVLNGLRPSIRQHVVQHPLATLDDVRHWGRVTELSLKDNASASSTLEASVKELTAGLDEKFRQLRIHTVGSASRPRSPSIDNSSTPNRVRFHNDAGRRSPHHDDDFDRRRPAEKHWRNPDPGSRNRGYNQVAPFRCNNCGGSHSRNNICPARDKTCFYCNRRGHLQSLCRTARAARGYRH